MLEALITTVIVVAAGGYSAWRLAPASWRNGLAARSGNLARATGAPEQLARRIEIKAISAAAQAGGCGSCGPCKGCGGKAFSGGPDQG